MKGATGIIIAECLSQLKWLWFKRERYLIDLVIWDEASRGAWGASGVVLGLRGRLDLSCSFHHRSYD